MMAMDEFSAKKKSRSKQNRLMRVIFFLGVVYIGLMSCSLSFRFWPDFYDGLAETFLPPYCDEMLFAEILASTRMQLRQDIFGNPRVIVLDDAGQDSCFFASTTRSSKGFWPAISPDGHYIAFTVNQFITNYDVVRHFFIVNTIEESYVRFSPENPEERFDDLVWSPDSTNLAYISSTTCCDDETYFHLNLINPDGELLWWLKIGDERNQYWGELLWSEDGEEIHYGHNAGQIISGPILTTYWCSVNQDGTNLVCDEQARP